MGREVREGGRWEGEGGREMVREGDGKGGERGRWGGREMGREGEIKGEIAKERGTISLH